MYKLLARGGLKPSDVDVLTMPFPDMVAALGNKSIDAGNLLEPAATQAITKGVFHENTGNRYKSRLTLAYNGGLQRPALPQRTGTLLS